MTGKTLVNKRTVKSILGFMVRFCLQVFNSIQLFITY